MVGCACNLILSAQVAYLSFVTWRDSQQEEADRATARGGGGRAAPRRAEPSGQARAAAARKEMRAAKTGNGKGFGQK